MSQKHTPHKQPKEPEPTPTEILAAINDFSTQAEEHFATKTDLLATKNDLKLELQQYATKEDLKLELQRYPTKIDLKLELQQYATKDDLKQELHTLENNLVTKLDRILVNTERLETERIAHVAWLQRHDAQFKKLLPPN